MVVLAQHLELEGIDRGQHRPRAHREVTEWNPREVVHAEHGLDRELLEQAAADRAIAAALGIAGLLGRLEDEAHSAVETAALGEILGGTQEHGGVAVVPAGMHLSLVLRAVREVVLLA